MANNDQEEFGLPIDGNEPRKTSNLLPRTYRTDSNKKFLQATLDQLTQPGKVKKLNGYIGQQNAKSAKSDDIYIDASDQIRQQYQLEPGAVIQDKFENITFYKDYIDYINQIDVFGGDTKNHERINRQEFYSWNPHIEWDKFVNFQNYYWLAYGPDVIKVFGQQLEIESTYTVDLVDEDDNYAFLFSPNGLTRNPTLRLYRGQTYNFTVNSPGNPFSFKLSRTAGDLDRYLKGVSAVSVESGTITFKVRKDAPDLIYYVNEKDPTAGGVIQILDIEENTFLDLEKDILGKKDYTLTSGVKISNGMKLNFEGNVSPAEYKDGNWYVDGVGSAITLIPESALEIISTYTQDSELLFDDTPFDKDPFSVASAYPRDNDYIVMARGSKDRNPWSRYNRWFHEDVIKVSAQANGNIPDIDQSLRAVRPIIEYEANIKLYNFGHEAKKDVDLIDTFTTDVFSIIEGSTGYNIDGVNLAPNMRVLFTADPDILVKDKIFKVTFVDIIVPQRQIEFVADSTVNPNTDVITFETDHFLNTGVQVTYLNNGNNNISGLSNRQQYYVYVVSATQIKLFTDSKLTKQVDILTRGTSTHKFEVFSGKKRQINLVEEPDTIPIHYETVIIKNGDKNKGSMFWYNGVDWKLAQTKTTVNQPILFDVFDSNNNSYSDITVYEGSTFIGNKIFSYKQGSGLPDKILGFPLSYKNINNVGDIVFTFDLLQDTFNYKTSTFIQSKRTDIGFLRKIFNLDTWSYENGWKKSEINSTQPIIRIFKESGLVNNFPVDVYDNTDQLSDLEVRVYINGKRLNRELYTLERGVVRFSIVLDNDVTVNDIVTLKCFSQQAKNSNGYYEIPISLQNNPLNNNLESFTLGEVVDHVNSIVDNILDFKGMYPGPGNLRDLGNLTAYGTRIVQHSSPLNLPLYHLTNTDTNIVKSIIQAQEDYATFKRTFLITSGNTGVDMDAKRHVDLILEMMLKDRPSTTSYYLSDMFGYAGSTRLEYLVEDGRFQRIFSISRSFSLDTLSNQAVYVYRNGQQLIEGIDYIFENNDVFFTIIGELNDDDIIEVYEYETTDGSFCPPTPTKLGLYPKFKPSKYIDDTYLESREVIQGHDGSITFAYGDYRDDLLLELELRIYNNIKQKYDPSIFDIWSFIPGYNRKTNYTKEEFERALSPSFFQWTSNINQDFTKQTYWDSTQPFTFNYRGNYYPDGTDSQAFWRGIYCWLFDTDRPHTDPWECLGFSVQPTWWQEVYGAAPYTKDNQLLWEDLSQGIIREPGKPPRYHEKFARPLLANSAPVDELGNLISPLNSNYVSGPIKSTPEGFYSFGDRSPVETAWRRSSYYPFALIKTILLLYPNIMMSVGFDRSRQVKNNTNQIVYSPSGLRIRLSDIVIPSTVNDATRIFSSGLVNYIVEYATSDVTFKITNYQEDLRLLTNKISHKLGGFTSKTKFNILLDSKNPTSSGGVFVPDDNFNIFLNTSSPVKKLAYSGVVVSRYSDGFEVRGYNFDEPFFTYYSYRQNERVIRVGGISESYVTWDSNKTYVAGKIVLNGNVYFRTKITHQSGDVFDDTLFAKLPGLPMTGGAEAILRKSWDTSQELFLAYGTKLATIQEVIDFLQGYGTYLQEQGFVFDQYNPKIKSVTNWETSINEFLFWTTQNWGEGSALSLSPAASKLVIKSDRAVVDDIRNAFYGYKIFKVDGQLLGPEFVSTFRGDNEFSIIPQNTVHGIYGGIFYLVQKEHVLLLDNTTLFNDVIYDQEPGYRQERIKIIGYITTNWNGGLSIPGFIFDQAYINDYQSWTDYNLGDIVKYKEYYYSASKFVVGTETFNSEDWVLLREKPTPKLIPNWDYKAEQFTDFYDLDTDNFDSEQQRMAQHLIGYQNRQYLENIIKDDVSQYKFYQGMIIEKGTQNVLNKLFDVLSADNQESLTFNEEWAVRVGEYGASGVYEEIEFKLDESKFRINPQPIQLLTQAPDSNIDLIYRITLGEVHVRPLGYNNNPWPTLGMKKALRSPGYVRYEDVKINIDTLDEVLDTPIDEFEEGDYVWTAFENRDWNVYRFTKNIFRIEDVEYSDGTLTLQCETFPDVTAGSIIGITHSEKIKGFYKVESVSARKIIIKTVVKDWNPPFADSSEILTYKFTSSRLDSIDNANAQLPPYIKDKELLWADIGSKNLSYNGVVPYTVYSNEKIFLRNTLENTDPMIDIKFGSKVSLCKNGKFLAVSTAANEVYIYEKSPATDVWYQHQLITPNLKLASTTNLNFGDEIAFSADGKWLAIAASTASNIKSNWKGDFYNSNSYAFGDVVQVRNTHFSARRSAVANDLSTVDRFSQDWAPTYLVTTEESKSASSNINQGYVNLYLRTSGGNYGLLHSFVSPTPTAGELFGSKMTFAQNGNEYILSVTSSGYNENQGRVYMFRYAELEEDSTQSGWHMDYRRSYVGIFSPGKQYYPGDIVFYNYELYQCITEQDPNSFEANASGWQILDDTSILGYFPQDVTTNVTDVTPIVITNIVPNTPVTTGSIKFRRATISYATQASAPFTAGQFIEIRNANPEVYNGDWLVYSASATQTVIVCPFPRFLPAPNITVEDPLYKYVAGGILTLAIVSPTREQNVESVLPGDLFGYDVSMSGDGSKLVISAPNADQNTYNNYKGKFRSTEKYDVNDVVYYTGGVDPAGYYSYKKTFDSSIAGTFNSVDWRLLTITQFNNTGKIFTYEYDGDAFVLIDTLGAQNLNLTYEQRFGESLSVSDSGSHLAVGSTLYSADFSLQGSVKVFEAYSGSWAPYQTLTSTVPGTNHKFGHFVEFMNDSETLVVYSVNADIKNETTFDDSLTKFDNSTLRVIDLQILSGRVDIFDKYNTNYVFGESLTTNSTNDFSDGYGKSIAVGSNNIVVSAAKEHNQGYEDAGIVYSYRKPAGKTSWSVLHYERARPNVQQIKKAFLYNRRENILIKYLDIVDPVQGKIPGPADQEIKFKTYYDPATYTVGNASVNVDDGMSWTNTYNGMLWWDLTTAKFLENQGGEIVFRSTTWNTLYETASIDIYEWIESKLLPSERDKISDTEKGLISGISGKSKYGDSVYSIKQKYDTISKTFNKTYYYWVKNSTIVPNKEGRLMSADLVSRLISDPRNYGYPCLVLLGPDSFSLVNVDSYLEDKDVVLSVQYWTVENKENNAHTQWKIISEHPNTVIPYEIEQKWLDSLLGRDKNGRTVPDLKLPVKQRFGIENRPRQSMFVNRIEALKQFIDRVNAILKPTLIVDEFDLTPLTKLEEPPSAVSGAWDIIIDTDEEFRFVGTSNLEQIKLLPVIEDGKIVDIEVTQRGKGYVNPPTSVITGKGKNAEIQIYLNDTGGVESVSILNQGFGYKSDTIITVRPFSVLVQSDSDSYDKWSIYHFNRTNRSWTKNRSQSYDVTKFWNYADWYLSGYDQFTKFNYIVENTYELAFLESNIGNIVKVKNVGTGGWILFEKYNDVITTDYTQNYKVIGRQNGTIQFLDLLYNFKGRAQGFDALLYDAAQYDAVPSAELSIILDTIKTKLLVDNLRVEYLKLFFSNVRYALSEQPFLDWVMKTSFVKATHNAGELQQKTNYNSDNLQDFESYVNEVKPYRTKVREYISGYTRLDNAALSVTDFDLPPIIDEDYKINPLTVMLNENYAISSSYSQLLDYPWKHWYDNASYSVETLELVDGGKGYIDPPAISIIDDYGIVTSTNTLQSNFDGPNSFWNLGEGTMKVVATGLPCHSYGIQDAENIATDQDYSQILPLRGGTYAAGIHASIPQGIIGYWLNGVAVFNPSAGDTVPEGFESIMDYNFNAAYASAEVLEYNFGHDRAGGLVTADGEYSYRDFSFKDAWLSGIGNDLADVNKIDTIEIPYLRSGFEHADGHSKIIGFALDGYPIYGPDGYSTATDPSSGIVRMTSSYGLRVVSYRPQLLQDTSVYPMGIFIQDYEYIGNGSLDKHNGRYCITPDYPNGTYAYFVTTTSAGTPAYPYVIGPTFFGDAAPQDRNDATNGKGTAPRTYSLYNSSAIQATAKAYITNGKVSRVVLTTSGSGYLKAPRVVFDGGLDTNIENSPAQAVAVLKNNVVRSNKTIIKFDRNTRNYFVTELTQVENFVGTGSRKQYSLRFSPILTIGRTSVKINGNEILRDDYALSIKKSNVKGFTTYYGVLTLETAPAIGDEIEITYDKNFEHLNAADRINFYYNPQTGQLGKDLAQLMTGIDYGGVIVSGLGLSIGGGWDSQPWFSEGWDGYDVGFTDYIVSVSDSTYVFDLPYVPAAGEQINVYVNGVRLDDEYFDSYDGVTVQPNGRTTAPEGRAMQTWVGDGIDFTIELPNLTSNVPVDINDGDKIIFRKSTSDGSINPDPKSFDTQLQGGNLGYTTATGFAPDDVVLDGGGRFVTPDTSHAPEEIVPGHITDALNIKVFCLPSSGSSKIISKNYICDGITTQFSVGQFPNNTAGLFVNLDNQILKQDVDYTLDWQTKIVTMATAPADKKIINITSFGTATENLLDSNFFVADGSTSDYITNAPWPQLALDEDFQQSIDRLGSIVLVNNQTVEYELFRTDDSYETTGFVGIRFPAPPQEDSIINYIMTGDANSTISLINSQALNIDGSSVSYSLGTVPEGYSKPYENYILVVSDGNLLRPAESLYWKMSDNEYVYEIPNYKALPFTLDPSTIKVYINGVQLSSLDYTLNNSNLTIEVRDFVYENGAILTLTRFEDTDYTISGNNIIFDIAPTSNVDVVTFFNHSVQNIVRSREYFNITSALVPGSTSYYQYQSMKGGALKLFRLVQSDDYIWVAKNRELLVHSVDYYLDDDRRTIKFKDTFTDSDVIDVILFGDKNVTNSFGFMQFKDMLNRTHYKRISKNKSTRLAKDLNQRDLTIEVENGAVLSDPNRALNLPGIVEINGERIEYLTKNVNVLGQLRRATLGTGSPAIHRVTSVVLDIGPTETIPYNDEFIVESSIGDGSTRNIGLSYAPVKVDTDWYTETIPANYGRSDELEVFVGGYRLKKTPYSLFDETNQYQNSPEGDNQYEAEFSVNGTEQVRLTNEVAENIKITVIKKVGRVWEDSAPPAKVFRNIPVGSGGAVFDANKNGLTYTLTLRKGGINYSVGDVLIILGSRLGGATPENDIVITVTDVSDDSSASILGYTYTGIGASSGFTTVSLLDSDNPVANFLKNTEAVWPQYFADKYQYVLLTDTGESITVDGEEPLELD